MLKNLFISSFYEEISPQEWNLLENEARKIKGEFFFSKLKCNELLLLQLQNKGTRMSRKVRLPKLNMKSWRRNGARRVR